MAPSSSATTTSVQVALRIRPATQQDASSIPSRFQRTIIHAVSNQAVSVDPTPSSTSSGSVGGGAPASLASATPGKKQTFAFDQVLGPDTTQHELFQATAEPILARFLEGFNCTILAYGQTSSGKTYSMTGVDLDADPSDPYNGMGIIPRSVSTIFSRAKDMKEEKAGAWNYTIKGSFVELYNEDLIDLLSIDDSGGRREVQIREDKDGHIIWGGLREVAVKNATEVMGLIRQGTAIRRTNETDMNAQSSRSHAIFSLTLTQKKFTGSGPPPRSSTPVPPGGRSPSRLARPSSAYSSAGAGSSRVASPTFGRPPTPSFASAMGRAGGGGLRPSSALGSHTAEGRSRSLDEEAGEWVTVVSKFHFVDLAGSERLKRTAAAGDRIKEGISINSGLLALGNVISALGDPARAKSHTASHVPYRDSKLTRLLQDSLGGNAHTLMIACVSPAEWNAGETVNTLKYANRARNIKNRATVTEKEEGWDDVEWLQNMVTRLRRDVKNLKEGGVVVAGHEPAELEGAGKKVLNQMVELQGNYENLRAKFVERTEELTRLRRELGEKQRNASSGAVGGTSKYEEIVGPVIEEYEKTISAMEAELSLNRAALRHTNDLVEEKEEELSVITERHAATELYVEELKSRVIKLSEREASTEAYIHDLEEKIKHHEDTSMSSSESVSDFKREIARHKDSEGKSAQYIADLESRLARSDESVLALREAIERLEREGEARRDEVEVLQARLESLLNDGESWRSDLEERERKVKELEAKMDEWEAKKIEVGEERIRLGGFVNGVQKARQSLEVDMNTAAKVNATNPSTSTDGSAGDNTSLSSQLNALQETHAATLADLSSVTSKYRDALREISDLAGQIQEAKLSSPTTRSDSPERLADAPPMRRRLTGAKSRDFADTQISPRRRPFFRQAASSESLHSRSLSQSQLLSQELFSARSRMPTSPETNGFGNAHSRSSSSSQPSMSISLPPGTVPGSERSVASLEKEIMRLQEVLKEREGEITVLETTLKDKEKEDTASAASLSETGEIIVANGHTPPSPDLSPQIMRQFEAIRRSVELRHPPAELDSVVDPDDSLVRLNELMLSMAQKESRHREVVEDLNEQLAHVRRKHDDLSKLSRDQAHNMSNELEVLRGEHGSVLAELEALQSREAKLLEDRNALEHEHSEAVKTLQSQHERAMLDQEAEVSSLLAKLKEEHNQKLSDLHNQLAEASSTLTKSQQDHQEIFGKLTTDHEEELRRLKQEVDDALAHAKAEHDAAVAKEFAEHQDVLKAKEEEHSAVLQRTEEEYYTALDNLRAGHAETISRKDAESRAAFDRLREEHVSALKMAELAREGTLTESQSSQAALLKQLQDEHSLDMERREAAFAEDLSQAKAEHARVLSSKDEDHRAARERLKTDHSNKLAKFAEEKDRELEALSETLTARQREHESSISELQQEREKALKTAQEQHATALEEMHHTHQGELASLKAEHEASRAQDVTAHEELSMQLQKERTEEMLKLKAEHQQAIAEIRANLIAAQEQHRQDLQEAREQSERLIAQERQHLATSLADLEKMHAQERETLRNDHNLLLEELESYKAASDEFAVAREQARVSHASALLEKDGLIDELERNLGTVHEERLNYLSEVEQLQAELKRTRSEQQRLVQEASARDTLLEDLERHRSLLSEVQNDLQRTKDHRDTLVNEKSKQDSLVRELQVQLARTASPPPTDSHPSRPTPDRNTSYSRVNGASKLPPLTPPPSVPPPPAPKAMPHVPSDIGQSVSSHSSNLRSSSSSRESQPDTPLTSTGPPSTNGHTIEPKITAQLEEQARHIDEQEVMIKTLNKQLTHCESDLQAHMDLVSTLETSLGDSEKNLRKARMQATEIARERDTLNGQIERLRNDLEDAKLEIVTLRRSVVEEKQTLENRLDEERRAKERARAQLDSRVEELQKRKSKFMCL